jgi:hypothetical protein
MLLPVSRHGVDLEKTHALMDVQQICQERGNLVTINIRTEGNVQRDSYGSIKSRETQTASLLFYAWPVIFSPSEKVRDKTGIKEKCELSIHTAMQDWIDAGYTLKRLQDIDMILATVVMNETRYEIKEKSLYSPFEDSFLYVVLALNKR